MKYFLSIIMMLSSLYICTNDTIVFAAKVKQTAPTLIERYEADITGDGQNEVIELKGIPFSDKTNYYQDIWIEVDSSHNKHWKINYGGGYEPTLHFIDLNNDQVSDIFYQSAVDENKQSTNNQLHTVFNGHLKSMPLPEQRFIEGRYTDNFNVKLKLSPASQPINIDLNDQAEMYMNLGIYDRKGKLLKSATTIIDPIALFEPFPISESKGYGLKSYKQVNGGNHDNPLGTVETSWYFENNDWIILQSKWVPTSEQKRITSTIGSDPFLFNSLQC